VSKQSSWSYRLGQVRDAVTARMSDADRADALASLTPELGRLFLAMSVRDQRHSMRVLRLLRQGASGGRLDPVLAQAALLHDVGKAEVPLGIPGRSLLVLAEAFGGLDLLQRMPVLGARVRRYRTHPQLGAAMVERAGAAGALVEIVAEHQADQPRHPETLRLQGADGRE
jgi:putative nucleotidyltransferase with HDIG domain